MEPGNLGIWDQEMKTLKIKICVAHNFGKVWASFEAIVPKTKNAQTKAVLLIFLNWPRGPTHPVWGHMLVSFDEPCFAGNDSSIVDHALSVVRNHTDHAKGYGSALRVYSKSMNWSLGIWWLLRCAIRETEWAHQVKCSFCIPEGNYRVHTAFPKPDLSGLWVWTPN